MNWESIDEYTERAKVFGGWLVKVSEPVYHTNTDGQGSSGDGWDWRIALTFVPDNTHQWKPEVYMK